MAGLRPRRRFAGGRIDDATIYEQCRSGITYIPDDNKRRPLARRFMFTGIARPRQAEIAGRPTQNSNGSASYRAPEGR
jgi:hypothetical protein